MRMRRKQELKQQLKQLKEEKQEMLNKHQQELESHRRLVEGVQGANEELKVKIRELIKQARKNLALSDQTNLE